MTVIGGARRTVEHDVVVGGLRLHLREVGEAHAPPVLFVVIADGGHDFGVEQPEAVADAVLGFLP